MTYKKWAEKAVSEYTCEFGRGAFASPVILQ